MHPFAKYIQILGKGRNGMRSLSRDEAYEAMRMIACYDVEPEQLGAFLMLMRVKEETAEEVAGFTWALRESLPSYSDEVTPAIDWAAYAGKKRQLPWFVLAALLLARKGYPVLMHGMSRNDERVYVPDALAALDIETASTMKEAQAQLKANGFAYLPISKLSPLTADLITTRELFGLRPPLHTVARMLNPLSAPCSVMGVFHPNFAQIHQRAARLLGHSNTLVCKGEGGEFERVPDRQVDLYGVIDNQAWLESWEKMIQPGKERRQQKLNLNHYRAVWEGEVEDSYGEAAVIGTLALVMRAMELASCEESAHQLATEWWHGRNERDLERCSAGG